MRRPDRRQLVLLGGGHSHLAVLRRLAMRPLDGLRVVLVAREVHAPYSGMLPGLLHGWYGFDDCHFDLRRLAAAAGARLHVAAGIGLDVAARTLTLDDGHVIDYDVLSLNCGATPRLPAQVDPAANVVSVKPISTLLPYWQAALARVRARSVAGAESRVVVVGAGAAGCELALALVTQVHTLRATVTLVDAGDMPARSFAPAARRALESALSAHGIGLRLQRRVVAVTRAGLTCADGDLIEADEVIWATSVVGPSWLGASGLACSGQGLLLVDDMLRCVGQDNVFAAGDVACLPSQPRPRAGVFAVRQGPVLAENLVRTLLGRPLRRYRAQRRFLSIVALPGRQAIASRGGLSASGAWVWRLKDRIDRRFMTRFALPPMSMQARPFAGVVPGAGPDDEPYCAGCAAKLGDDVLGPALADARSDGAFAAVLVGMARPDDAAILAGDARPLVATIDGLRSIEGDLTRAAALATVHALGDCHAMGGTPTGVLAWATVERASTSLQRADLMATMRGVRDVLDAESIPLLGGHSSAGLESSLGITVLGALPADGPWLAKGGLRDGDLLVLTKPLGVATLFAAPMRGMGRARWVEAAVASMRVPLRTAAEAARGAGATAATDVTGFGLLGHLAEMLRAAGRSASLALDAVPVLDGALALAAAGVESSLAPANEAVLAQFVLGRGVALEDPRLRLLIDPQTCGGLLFGVQPSHAAAALQALRAAGVQAAVIGAVAPRRTDGALGDIRLLASLREGAAGG